MLNAGVFSAGNPPERRAVREPFAHCGPSRLFRIEEYSATIRHRGFFAVFRTEATMPDRVVVLEADVLEPYVKRTIYNHGW